MLVPIVKCSDYVHGVAHCWSCSVALTVSSVLFSFLYKRTLASKLSKLPLEHSSSTSSTSTEPNCKEKEFLIIKMFHVNAIYLSICKCSGSHVLLLRHVDM